VNELGGDYMTLSFEQRDYALAIGENGPADVRAVAERYPAANARSAFKWASWPSWWYRGVSPLSA